MGQYKGFLGVVVLLAIALVLSNNRRRIDWRVVIAGIVVQLVLAWLCLSFDPVVDAFDTFAQGVTKVISFADKGSAFIFGKAADASQPWGFIFAVKVLPVIVFFASLMSVLYHIGVMQVVVAGIAWILRKALRITGVEALSASANIFLGQTEAPLCVKPYLATMTRAQIMTIMTGGFATIAGSVMAAYVGILGGEDPASRVLFAKHLMTASLMSAPAGLLMARILYPETETPLDESFSKLAKQEKTSCNLVDAAAGGASDGLRLALNVAAMLVAFVALLAMVNYPLEWVGHRYLPEWLAAHHIEKLSLEVILGWIFSPLAWTMGVSWEDSGAVGGLMGTQVIATEFVAYLKLSAGIQNQTIGPRAAQIVTYALCGFANLPSIGIQIGGLSALAPERRQDLARIGLRAMVAGALACWMTGAVASVFIEMK